MPGDKSISHRAIMLGAIAKGKLQSQVFSTEKIVYGRLKSLSNSAFRLNRTDTDVVIDSPGINNWKTPTEELYAGNSGTTARLMLGILAGSKITAILTGDESLSGRPMDRVTIPLQKCRQKLQVKQDANLLPLKITGTPLTAIDYENPVASAQVKSAILFAGLHAEGTTTVREKTVSRDHTEQMLRHFGAEVHAVEGKVSITGGSSLQGTNVHVPGDISSAAFFMVAAGIDRRKFCDFFKCRA